MRILSLDTSYKSGISLALLEDDSVLESLTQMPDGNERGNAVSQLLPLIDKIMQKSGWEKKSLTNICVGLGPGSFTGVRVGVVTARSLAQALQIPILGINIFETIVAALNSMMQLDKDAGVILDGGRNHIFVAAYDPEDLMNPLIEPEVVKPQDLLPFLKKHSNIKWFCEEKVIASFNTLSELSVEKLPEITEIASVQGAVARKQLISSNENQEAIAIDHVKPLYLRGASVTLKNNASNK